MRKFNEPLTDDEVLQLTRMEQERGMRIANQRMMDEIARTQQMEMMRETQARTAEAMQMVQMMNHMNGF